jgi:hypothetical protein
MYGRFGSIVPVQRLLSGCGAADESACVGQTLALDDPIGVVLGAALCAVVVRGESG